MDATIDYYSVLELTPDASKEQIKRAYRSLSMKYHPDRNPEHIEKMQIINEAYEILGDDNSKAHYDMMRQGGSHNIHFFSSSGVDPHSGLGAFLSAMMSGSGIHPDMMMQGDIFKPASINMEYLCPFHKIFSNHDVPMEIERIIYETTGRIVEKETIYTTIPAGIDDGEIITLKGMGHVNEKRQCGDVKVHIHVVNDTDFKRDGLDLIYVKSITLKEFLCGFEFKIHFPNGSVKTVKNSGGKIFSPMQMIVKGCGIQRGDKIGNLILKLNVVYPDSLSEDQIKALNEIL
jgi:DnaJ-class molecular chaperone